MTLNECQLCLEEASAVKVSQALLITQCWSCGYRKEYCLNTKLTIDGYVDLEYTTTDLWTDYRWLFINAEYRE